MPSPTGQAEGPAISRDRFNSLDKLCLPQQLDEIGRAGLMKQDIIA